MLGSSCADPVPTAETVSWAVKRTEDRKGYELTGSATLQRGLGGWYQPTATLLDDRGCRHVMAAEDIQDADTSKTGTIATVLAGEFELKRPVARVDFSIDYNEAPGLSMNPADIVSTNVFSDSRVLDPKITPRDDFPNPCNKSPSELKSRTERLRERAKANPYEADGEAIDNMSRDEVIATAINSAGFLCARVTDIFPSGGDIVASCMEYRSGKGRAKYRINTTTMSVEKVS